MPEKRSEMVARHTFAISIIVFQEVSCVGLDSKVNGSVYFEIPSNRICIPYS